MPAEWAGRPVLVRRQLESPMYDFKSSFSLAFVYIHRTKYVFSRDMFCLPHFWGKIHGVSGRLSLQCFVSVACEKTNGTPFFMWQMSNHNQRMQTNWGCAVSAPNMTLCRPCMWKNWVNCFSRFAGSSQFHIECKKPISWKSLYTFLMWQMNNQD